MTTENAAIPVRGKQTLIVRPDEGKILQAFGDKVQVKLSGEEMNGAFVLGFGTTPLGHGPQPHIHHREDELFIIVSGRFRFLGEDGWSEPAGLGSVVYTPRGVRHTFQNAGNEPGRHYVLATPSGFERFFGQCAEVFAVGGAPEMQTDSHYRNGARS